METPVGDMPYCGVICVDHGRVDLTAGHFDAVIGSFTNRWKCPKCGKIAKFDEDRWAELNHLENSNG